MRRLTLSLLLLPLLAACSSDPHDGKVTPHVRDHEAYTLGKEHAARVAAVAADEGAVQEALLDVRARISNIRSKISPQSAADYETGFRDGLRHDCDSLARLIF